MKKFGLLFLLIFSIISLLFAEEVVINQNPFNVELISSDFDKTIIDYSFGRFIRHAVEIEGEEFFHINLQSEANLLEKGVPELPHISRSIIIPDYALTDVRVIASDYVDLLLDIAPSKGNILRNQNPDEVPYTFADVYEKNAFYPEQLTELSEPYILRDFRGQVVRVFPFQYNPVTGVLRVYHRITVEVNNIGTDTRNVKYRQRDGYTREFEYIYRNRFLNFSTNRYTPLEEQGRMIVIAFDSFVDATMPYVNWKNQKGIPTTIYPVSTIGTTATAIMNFVEDQYDLNDGLTFLQLIGDAAQIPTFTVEGGGSDPSYSLLEGNDNYGDIFVGRFSAENVAQVQTQVARTIHYERDMTTADTWLRNAMGVASNEGPGYDGLYDHQHLDVIRTQLLNYNYIHVDEFYQPSATATMVTNAVNAGRGFANYTGHGSNTSWSTTGFSNTHVNALTNDYKLPFILSVACVNGNFTATTCFAEAWLRATNGNAPTGAIAMYASSVNQAWVPPMAAQREVANLLVADAKTTIGGLFFNGSFFMIELFGTSGANEFKNWHIFGDASLQVRSNTPQPMTVTYNNAIPVGANTLQVNTGVANSLVSLTTPEYEILAYGYTNSSGVITLSMANPPTEPVTLTLTATAYNRVTHVGSVEVLPAEGPYVVLDNYSLSGNQAHTPQYNEMINFTVTLSNVGVDPAPSVSATLSTSSDGVTIIDNIENFGTIAADGSITRPNAFTIETADNLIDQTTLNFTLDVTSGTDNWSYDFSFNVNAPNLEVSHLQIQDPLPGGNNNGRLDPGETVSMVFTIDNIGEAASQAGTATLSVNNPLVGISTPVYNITAISPGANIQTIYTVTVDESINPGTVVEFTKTIDYGAYTTVYYRYIPVGLVLEDFETGDFSSFPWEFAGNADWTIVTDNVYEGEYSAKSGTITHSQSTSMEVTLNIAANSEISFYRKVSSESGYDYLRFFIDGVQQAQWSGEVDWSEVSFPVNAGERTLRWTYMKDGSVSAGSDCAWVDYIVFPEILPQDSPRNLVAAAGNGYVNLSWSPPVDGVPLSYNLYRNGTSLFNTDLLNYTDNNVINGVTYSYYVTAVYSTYESNPSNTVQATPDTIQIIDIGDGTGMANYLPLNMYWKNSLTQTIYLASEIGVMGTLDQITYYNNFATNLSNKPVKIWVGETTATDLSSGWIPSTSLTLVFDGTVNFPSGENTIDILLQTPYQYDGQNLVIMVNRPMDTEYFSSNDRFYITTTGITDRTRYLYSDSTTYDPANPSGGTLTNQIPNTTLLFGAGEGPILLPPTNLVATAGNELVHLSWQSPTMSLVEEQARGNSSLTRQRIDDLNRDLTGFNIYRDGDYLDSVSAGVTVYSDTDVVNNVTYNYYVTAIYTEGESIPSNTVTATPDAFTLIWEEDFNPPHTGWTLGSNWLMQSGYLQFYYSPTVTPYDLSAISPNIYLPEDVGEMTITQLFSNYSAVDEVLEIIVIHDRTETVLWSYNCSTGSFDTADFVFPMTPFGGQIVQLKFRSHGSSTWNIDWWNIYNIAISGVIGDPTYGVSVSPEVDSKSGYSNTVVEYEMTVTNTGNMSDNYTLAAFDNNWNVSFWSAQRTDEYEEIPVIDLGEGMVYMEKTAPTIPYTRSEITETGFIAAGVSKQIVVQVSIPAGATGSDTAIIEIVSMSDSSVSATAIYETTSLGVFEPRYIAEWEPMQGVLIRYPVGLPYNLISAFSNDTKVYTIISSANLSTAMTNYSNNGVNMDNCEFIIAASDTYWTRDYGPWSVATQDGIGIVDFTYNRPRPNDNVIPGVVSNYFDIPYFLMPLTHTGGNMMGDGLGVGASTTLVLNENPSLSENQIDQIMHNYLGLNTYHKRPDPTGDTLNHIDTWAKFLAPDKIMIRSVHTGHPQYSQIEAAADYFAGQISSYGTPYQVFRVYTPNNEAYTNSVIVNNKVYVPQMGTANDAAAIVSYQTAMPGYEIVGFTGSWISNDAIHCRVIGVADQGMLYVNHIPPQVNYSGQTIDIVTEIIAYSGQPLDELRVYWKTALEDPYNYAPMVPQRNNDYVAAIPPQEYETTIYYYISASDQSGRTEFYPHIGADGPILIEVNELGTELGIPDIVEVYIEDGYIFISWEVVAGATDYIVESSSNIDGTFVPEETGSFSIVNDLVTWESEISGPMKFYRVKALILSPTLRELTEEPVRRRIRE
ncbi:MAG: agmatine deiminase family protein [Candidatus Cloacimonetes bacterium]|nr:agmatine deiminase family protein [Candidatus Cloacimonadota bacterium]